MDYGGHHVKKARHITLKGAFMIIAILTVFFIGATGGAVATVQNPELHDFVKEQVIEQEYLQK